MTNVDALIDLVRDRCPSFTAEWGFEADLETFLARNITTGRGIVFVAVGPQFPTESTETGEVDWIETFTITLRLASIASTDTTLYVEFLSLRDVLPGYAIPDTDRFVEVIGATPGIARGSHEATLSIQI